MLMLRQYTTPNGQIQARYDNSTTTEIYRLIPIFLHDFDYLNPQFLGRLAFAKSDVVDVLMRYTTFPGESHYGYGGSLLKEVV
jgi:hypothetical protein